MKFFDSRRRLMFFQGLLFFVTVLCVISCSAETVDKSTAADNNKPPETPKADDGELTDIEKANQFFLTQIYDKRWNPDGMESDTDSNNCGPASFAMVMAEGGVLPTDLKAEMAIDHARATMYAGYPEIDATELPEGATIYETDNLVFVDDDTHPVYFEKVDGAASLAQGIEQSGGEAVFGYSWDELDTLLATNGAVIAYGHITKSWRNRFDGNYGACNEGAIPHYISVFPATSDKNYIVCDPMYKGGAVLMPRSDLQAFFKSPVNVFETTIRLIARQAPDEQIDKADPNSEP